MTQALTLHLDALPPSTNKIWRAVKGRVIKSHEYRQWLDATAWSLRQQAGNKFVEGAYALRIYAQRPDRRRRDIDNLIKSISDAIVRAGLVEDDGDCERLSAEWEGQGTGVRILVISCGA